MMVTWEGTRRRASPRVDEEQIVQISVPGSGSQLTTGRTVNLSRGGARIEMGGELPLRSRVRLSLALGDEFIAVTGSVVYLEALDGGRCCVGVQSTDLDTANRHRLDAHLARRT